MPYTPPWLDIKPRDFLEAAQAGGALGQRLAAMTTEANIAASRIAASERENAARISAQAQGAAAARQQSASEDEANRLLREWESKQRIQLAQTGDQRAERALTQAGDFQGKQLALRQQANDLAGRKLDQPVIRSAGGGLYQVGSDGSLKVLHEAPGREPTLSVPVFPDGTDPITARALGISPTTVRGPMSKVLPVVGTNAPASLTRTATAAPTVGRVRVKSPDGKVGSIPTEQLDEALQEGYTPLE